MVSDVFDRVKRLIKSELTDLLDLPSEASSVERIETALRDIRAMLGRQIARSHHLSKALSEAAGEQSELAEKAAFAVDQGRDDLAQAALAHKLALSDKITTLQNDIRTVDADCRELEATIAALQARRAMQTHGGPKAAHSDEDPRGAQLAELDALIAATHRQTKT